MPLYQILFTFYSSLSFVSNPASLEAGTVSNADVDCVGSALGGFELKIFLIALEKIDLGFFGGGVSPT